MNYIGKDGQKFVVELRDGFLYLDKGNITTSRNKATSFTHKEMVAALQGKTVHIKSRIPTTDAFNMLKLSVYEYSLK